MADRFNKNITDDDEIYDDNSDFAQGAEATPAKRIIAEVFADGSDDEGYEQNTDFSKVLADIDKAFPEKSSDLPRIEKPLIPDVSSAEKKAPSASDEILRSLHKAEKPEAPAPVIKTDSDVSDDILKSLESLSQDTSAKLSQVQDAQPEPPKEEDQAVGGENIEDVLKKLDDMTSSEQEDEDNADMITDIASKRGVSHTPEISPKPVSRKSFSQVAHGLTGKIIPRTEEIDRPVLPDNASFEQKSDFVEKSRRKKVENFVLDSEKEEEQALEELERVEEEERRTGRRLHNMEEFKRFEDAPKALADILEIKNNLFIRLCILMFTSIASLFITLANDLDWPIIKTFDRTISPSAYVFTNTILGLISIAVAYNVMVKGIKNLFIHKPDCDSLAALSIFSAVIVGIVTLFEPDSVRNSFYHVFTGIAILGLMVNTMGKFMIIRRTERNFRYVAGDFERYAVKNISDEETAENFTRGMTETAPKIATLRKTEFVDGFVRNSYTPDVSDDYANRMSYPILIAAIIIAVLSIFFDKGAQNKTEKLFVALAAFSGVISMCASIASMLIVNVPLARATKKYLQYSSVMLGYSSVKDFADTNTVLADASQLFPEGMVELANLKIMSTVSIEDCILNAASLACQAGSVLKPTFYKMLRGKTELLYPVESYIYEDGMGLSGWIDNRRVLLGSRELMENHSIDGLPTIGKEKEYAGQNTVIYLSISGIVTAMFSVSVSSGLAVTRWMQELEKEGISIVVRSVDGFINKEFLADTFGVSPDSIRLLPFRYNETYEEETGYAPREQSSMLCSGRFPSLAMLVIGAKRLSFSTKLGAAVLSSAAALGAVICAIMMLTGSFVQITATFALVYNLAVTACALLVQHIKRF